MSERRESGPFLARREFLHVIGAAVFAILPISAACSLREENLDDFSKTLPRQVGGTTWTGEWTLINGPRGESVVEGYFDQSGLFRHKILLVKITTLTISGKPLTAEQMKAVFKKEVHSLYAYEFIDTVLAEKINLASYPLEEVHVLADGLAALSLSENEQKLLNLDYSDRQYNYDPQSHPSAGKPFYPDPESLTQSILKEGEFVVWDRKTLNLKILAAIAILSTRMKVINPQGIKTLGQDLFELIQAAP